jgi:hypothetical protein
MRSCIFCGNYSLTREDAWPLWLMRKFPKKSTGIMEGQIGTKHLPPWRQISPELKVKFICKECNNGWMSRLEDQVKPILEPIFNHETILISSQQQSILSAWAVKTAMVLEAIYSSKFWFYLPVERRFLMETLHPPALTYVWIAKCINPTGCYSKASKLTGRTNDLTSNDTGYCSTIGFGPLALQVLSMRLLDSTPAESAIIPTSQDERWSQATICVWPIQMAKQRWPPSLGLSGEFGLDELMKRWVPHGA